MSLSRLNVKYESYVINISQDNEQKPWVHYLQVTLVTLTFNLVNPKSKVVMALPRPESACGI